MKREKNSAFQTALVDSLYSAFQAVLVDSLYDSFCRYLHLVTQFYIFLTIFQITPKTGAIIKWVRQHHIICRCTSTNCRCSSTNCRCFSVVTSAAPSACETHCATSMRCVGSAMIQNVVAPHQNIADG